MTQRLAGSLTWALVLVLISLALAGCSRTSSSSATSTAPSPVLLAPTPASSALAHTDPAVWAAVRFEQAYCSWDWRHPQASYVAAEQQLATAQFGEELAADADPASWSEEVVAGHQQVTCTVSEAQRLIGAPTTATTVYVRMEVDEQVSSTMGSFDGGRKVASWRVEDRGGSPTISVMGMTVARTSASHAQRTRQWLVAGSFEGG